MGELLTSAKRKLDGFVVQRDELEGLPGALLRGATTLRAILDVFPPPGIGVFGAGLGFGCGFGWPMRAMYGPPRAFCGGGVGVAVVCAGYGQGIAGVRWGHDKRAKEAKANIRRVEDWIIARCAAVAAVLSLSLKRLDPREKNAKQVEDRTGGRNKRRASRKAAAFVVAPTSKGPLLRFAPPTGRRRTQN